MNDICKTNSKAVLVDLGQVCAAEHPVYLNC